MSQTHRPLITRRRPVSTHNSSFEVLPPEADGLRHSATAPPHAVRPLANTHGTSRRATRVDQARSFLQEMGLPVTVEQEPILTGDDSGTDSDTSGPDFVRAAWDVMSEEQALPQSTVSVQSSLSSSAPRLTTNDIQKLTDQDTVDFLKRNKEFAKYIQPGGAATITNDTSFSQPSTPTTARTPMGELQKKTFMTAVSLSGGAPAPPPALSNHPANVDSSSSSTHKINNPLLHSVSSLASTSSHCTVVMTPTSALSKHEQVERCKAETAFEKAMQRKYGTGDTSILARQTPSTPSPPTMDCQPTTSCKLDGDATSSHADAPAGSSTASKKLTPPPHKYKGPIPPPPAAAGSKPVNKTQMCIRKKNGETPTINRSFFDLEIRSVSSTTSSRAPTIKSTTSTTNFITKNKQLAAHGSKHQGLTKEEEQRVHTILTDERFEGLAELEPMEGEGYTLSNEEKSQVETIHQQLKELRPHRNEADWDTLFRPAEPPQQHQKTKTYRKNVYAEEDAKREHEDQKASAAGSSSSTTQIDSSTHYYSVAGHNDVVQYLTTSRLERQHRTQLSSINSALHDAYNQESIQLQYGQHVQQCNREVLDAMLKESREEQGIQQEQEDTTTDTDPVDDDRDLTHMFLPDVEDQDAKEAYRFIWDTMNDVNGNRTALDASSFQITMLRDLKTRDSCTTEQLLENAASNARAVELKKQYDENQPGKVSLQRLIELDSGYAAQGDTPEVDTVLTWMQEVDSPQQCQEGVPEDVR